MEPLIPNGAYCLFRYIRDMPREGRPALVWHDGLSDPHTGGKYTLKYFTVEPPVAWRKPGRVVLKPANKNYEPIILPLEGEGVFRVIAEFLEVLKGAGT